MPHDESLHTRRIVRTRIGARVSWHCEIRDDRLAIILPKVRLRPGASMAKRLHPSGAGAGLCVSGAPPRRGPDHKLLLRQVNGKAFEINERAVSQRRLMRGTQHHAWRSICLESFLPPLRAQTPAVAGFKSGKADFRHRRG